MKKKLATTMAIATLATSIGAIGEVSANEKVDVSIKENVISGIEDNTTKVQIGEIFVTLEYNEDDIIVERKATKNNISEIHIIDKDTNTLLESYTEKVVKINRNTSHHFINKHRYDGPVKTTLETVVDLYSSGSFRQINSVEGCKIFASSSSATTLEDKSARATSATGKFPTTKINMSGSGVITGTASKSSGADFSVEILKKAGFTISNQTSTSWHYRKPVSMSYSYSLY
jgi:hypothetical protein